MPAKQESFGRQIYLLYRYLVALEDDLMPGLGLQQMGLSHIHLLFTIGLEGVSNSGMARRAKVSKQAMSKLVREMLALELITIKHNEQDSRCNVISLTDKGADTLVKIWEVNKLIRARFDKQIGKAKSKKLLALMAELVDSLESEAGNTSHQALV